MKQLLVIIGAILLCTSTTSLCAQVGSGCLNPHKIDSLPFSLQNATNCGLGLHYFSPCPGPVQPSADPYMDSEEYILTYTPETDVEVNLVLKALSIDVPALYLLSDCPGSGSVQCIATMYQHNLQGDYEIKSVSLDSGLTYFIVVSGAGTCFDFDLEITLLSTSINERDSTHDQTWLLFPNPAVDQITISYHGKVDWKISDVTGREILKGKHREIDLKDMKPGAYLLQNNTGEKAWFFKN